MNAAEVLALISILIAAKLGVLAFWLGRRFSKAQYQLQECQDQLRETELHKIKAESDLVALRQSVENERKSWQSSKDQLQDTFKSLAAQALEGTTQQFLQLAKSTLEKESLQAKGDLDKRHQSIRDLLEPLRQTLDKYHLHVNEIEKARVHSYSALEGEIKRVIEASSVLSKETSALKDALKKPHVRGRWGEMQLKNCIELAGMSEFADVTFQDFTTLEDGQKLIPDMTVKMPGGHLVVVDAKTPIDAFIASLEAPTAELKQAEMARHGRLVKEHVKKLSTRAYYESLPESADFTIMFLPNESFLYAALESESDLMEFALQRKVLVATPPTLIGLLKVIRYGWNEEKLAENAQKISEAGKELHKRLVDFMTAYMNIGKQLEKAKNEFDVGLSRLNSRVLVQAKRLEQLGAKSAKDLPASSPLSLPEADFTEPLHIVEPEPS